MSFNLKEKLAARELAGRVKAAFPDPSWPENQLPSDDLDSLEGEYIISHFSRKRWTEITDKELGWTAQDSYSFTDEALAYFFPAWMVSFLEEHYPGAANFGCIHFAYWVPRLSPFRNFGYSREQTQLLRDIMLFIVSLCGDPPEYCDNEVYALKQLDQELEQGWFPEA